MGIKSLNHFIKQIIYITARWCPKRETTVWIAVLFTAVFMFSCSDSQHQITPAERRITDSIVKEVDTEDSLCAMYKRFEREGNKLGSIVVLREIGKRQCNESRFDEALKTHSEGLRLTEMACDTLEMVQALNNIGTNYRRLGMFDLATGYHYRAWKISEEYSDTSEYAEKNRSVSLNGLGNIYMTTGNYERADSAFRMALEGEKRLRSDIGQAINHANIGSIFEKRGQMDSAWVYYKLSMKFNESAHSVLGVSLCHMNFGSLYQREKKYDKAIEEYDKAYLLMRASKDEWHALGSLLALAHIYCDTGREKEALEQLDKAKGIASRIKSKEHLAEIQQQYYLIYKKRGDWKKALDSYVIASEMQDSLVGVKKLNQIQNISLAVERNRQAIKMGEARRQYETERTTRNISIIVFSVIIVLLAGVVVMMLYIIKARTRTHRMLTQMSEMRETFFTNITHELRTPLTLILGLGRDIVNDEKLPENTRGMGKVIEKQGNSLLVLINQLLDISKVKSAVGEPDWRHGDIAAYIGVMVNAYREHAGRKGIMIQYESTGKLEMDFVPDFASKVINNLLSNAVKFTPEGGKITVYVGKSNTRQAVIRVADTGMGIKQENLAHIFEPFYQEEMDCKHLGTGVGLALVRQIIQSIKGTIEVESVVGKGTIFTIHAPLKHGDGGWKELGEIDEIDITLHDEDNNTDVEDSIASDSNRMRLLVIEDNCDVARYIGSRLSDKYDVFYAPNGREGLDKARQIVPDLIITDLMMPQMNGLEVCRNVRSDELISHVPIIVVTAKVTDEERIEGLKAGADAYLCKPFNEEELRVRVEKLLEQRRNLREKFSKMIAEGKEQEIQMNDADKHFVGKMVDAVYLLMDNRKADVCSLAEKLCMSPRQLHRKMIALTGESPTSYIIRIKMKKAKLLLDTKPELTLEEIADRCCFDHYSGFYHAFRKHYGVSPTQYKRGVDNA